MTNREHKKLLRAIRHRREKNVNNFASKTDRVEIAINSAVTNRAKYTPSLNNCCLPKVALYRAGYRK